MVTRISRVVKTWLVVSFAVLPAMPAAAQTTGGRASVSAPRPVVEARDETPRPTPATAPAPGASTDPAFAPPGPLANVELLGSSAASIRFRVTVPAPVFETLAQDAGFSTVSLDGYVLSAAAGEPALPRRIVWVAVPPTGEVRVSATTTAAFERTGLRLAPQPVAPAEGSDVPVYEAAPGAYARASSVAPSRARLLGVSWMRNQRVAQIEILPLDYTPASGAVRVYGTVDVSVDVAGAVTPAGALREPVDPFEEVYRLSLINYDQGRAWRRPARSASDPGERRLSPAGLVPDTSVFAGRTWVKLRIPETGFYRVKFDQLRITSLFGGATNTPIGSLRLFTWPGVPVLPEANYCDSCGFREVAIRVIDDNGVFDDNNDAIEFFAMGASDYSDLYDPSRPDTVFVNNPYESLNYYYLTIETPGSPVGGDTLRYGTRSGQIVNGAAPTPTSFRSRAHFERDLEYLPDATPGLDGTPNTLFWEKWYWRSLAQGQTFSTNFDLPGLDATQPARMRISAWGISYTGGCTAGQHGGGYIVNGGPEFMRYWNQNTGHIVDSTFAAGTLLETGNTFTFESLVMPCPGYIHRTAFAWFDVFYPRRFVAVGDSLSFDSPATPGDYIYRITGFTGTTPPHVYDVTDAYAPIEITALEFLPSGAEFVLRFESNEPGQRHYRIVRDANSRPLAGPSVFNALATSIENLRSPALGADYVVIYYDGLKQAADSLLAWRTSHLPLIGGTPPFETIGVPISALYDQFSGGRTDPAAIRNFLRATFNNWRKVPAFVTFLGDASYDFKNLLGRARAGDPGTLVPSYESGFDNFPIIRRQFATDDWLMNVDDPSTVIPDFFGGRIPAGDLNAANVYVQRKLLAYERSTSFGDYRNRVMLIADDDRQGQSDDALHWEHVRQTEDLQANHMPLHIDRKEVYLHTYPTGPGFTKPGAKADIIEGINDGVAIVNYVGHGSPFKMADESVFLDSDAGALTNRDRPTVFVAASCDIGKFNDPTVLSLGERLVLEANGGGVGVISATELALSSLNAQLNRTLYDGIFKRQPGGSRYGVSLAEALLVAKVGGFTTQKYQLMGDAGLHVNLPQLWVEFSLWDSAGTTPVAAAARGQVVTVRGQVYDYPGGTPVSYDGVGSLLIEDAAPLLLTPNCYQCSTTNPTQQLYHGTAGPMFRGDVGIHGGAFETRFLAPLEAKLGAEGRVRAYLEGHSPAQTAAIDGVGATALNVVDGTAPAGDTEGPLITLSFPGGARVVKPDAVLTVSVSDPSGVLTTAHTLQNGIIVTIDGNTTARVDITSSFRYAADSYQTGTAAFTLPGLSTGGHEIRVSAADNLAAGLDAATHRSSATISFEVQEAPRLKIVRAYLFPNPTHSSGPGSGGQFVVDTPGDSVNVLLRIYTVTGRQVKVLRSLGGLGQVQLPWDGRDSDGAPLGNGVYFFKVHVNPRDDQGESDPSQKATAEGRIVIVGH
jgi:Peptidase family C25/Propeptide_C25